MEPLNIEARYPSHKVQISITDNGRESPDGRLEVATFLYGISKKKIQS
jgi:hypothetical protein